MTHRSPERDAAVALRAIYLFGAAICGAALCGAVYAFVIACDAGAWEERTPTLTVVAVISCSSTDLDATCSVTARDEDGKLRAVTTTARADVGDRLLCDAAGICSLWWRVSP